MSTASPTRLQIGGYSITTLLDGTFPCGPEMITAAASPEGRFLFEEAGFPALGPSPEPINAFALQMDERLWMIDAGCGDTAGLDLGHARRALEAAGHRAENVDTIVLTHMHPDHIGGLLVPGSDKRLAAFANAELIIPAAELAFWTDPLSPTISPREPPANFELAAAVLSTYQGRIQSVAVGAELAPGIRYVPLPGHTLGHSGVAIEGDGRSVLMWADIVHSTLLQLRYPDWSIGFDMDPAQAVQCRQALLARLATEETMIIGSHVIGLGHVRKLSDGYAFQELDPVA